MTWNIDRKLCLKCGACVSVCPVAALELKEEILQNPKICTLCGVCEGVCPVSAIKVTKGK